MDGVSLTVPRRGHVAIVGPSGAGKTSLSQANVSGGERQRIAVARAMLRAPDVLLLDEATAQVDALTESAIGTAIRSTAAAARC